MDHPTTSLVQTDTCTQTSTPKELAQRTLESNKILQQLLTKQAERLEAELQEADRLLNAVGIEDGQDEPDTDIQVPGAKKATGPFPPFELLNPESPFFEEASRRSRYLGYTNVHPMKGKELDVLADAVRHENQRLQAIRTQTHGQNSTTSQIDLDKNVDGLDWNIIAEKVLDISKVKRTADECRIRWVGDRRPTVNHGDWSVEESSQLENLISTQKEESNKVDWVDVAKQLGTNRTPIDCMRRGIPRQRHIWTSEADAKLLAAVKFYGVDNWNIVATCVSEHATAGQCQGRYCKSIDPSIRRVTWTEEEDVRLRRAVGAYGGSWMDISTCVPGRTNDRCRERWFEHLNADTSKNQNENATAASAKIAWTDEEDEILLESVKTLGNQWKVISQKIGNGKSDANCRSRYFRLQRLEEVGKAGPSSEPSASKLSKAKPRARKSAVGKSADASEDSAVPSAAVKPKPKPRPVAKSKGKGKEKAADAESEPAPGSSTGVEETDKDVEETSAVGDKEDSSLPTKPATKTRGRKRAAPVEPTDDENTSTAMIPVAVKPKPKPRPVAKSKAKQVQAAEPAPPSIKSAADEGSEMDVDEIASSTSPRKTNKRKRPAPKPTARKKSKTTVDPSPDVDSNADSAGASSPTADVTTKEVGLEGTSIPDQRESGIQDAVADSSTTEAAAVPSGGDSIGPKRRRGRPRKASAPVDDKIQQDVQAVPATEAQAVTASPSQPTTESRRSARVAGKKA